MVFKESFNSLKAYQLIRLLTETYNYKPKAESVTLNNLLNQIKPVFGSSLFQISRYHRNNKGCPQFLTRLSIKNVILQDLTPSL